jgi:hypothetical protein
VSQITNIVTMYLALGLLASSWLSTPSPGTCHGWWSPIAAAGPQSTLSGVLAGFVFTGIVVVLSTSPDTKSPAVERSVNRSYALQLLASAFIIFALDSYFTSICAGELACNRANAEAFLSGGALGTGALMLIAGLSWLLITYSEQAQDIRSLLKVIVISVWVIIVIMFGISGLNVGQALLYDGNQDVVDFMPVAVSVLVGILVTTRYHRFKSWPKEDLRIYRERLANSITRAAVTALLVGVATGLLTGIASAASAQWWASPPPWAVYLLVLLSMLVPASALIVGVPAGIGALSHKCTESGTDNASGREENGFTLGAANSKSDRIDMNALESSD